MKAFKKKPASYEDLRALPEQLVGEIIDGELIASPRPGPLHSNAATGLSAALRNPFQHGNGGPGGWWILAEPEVHFGHHAVVPDVAGWRRERLLTLPESAYFEVAPDWVCEVLSPTTAGIDRLRKMPLYLVSGVTFVWLVDPVLRTVEVFRNGGDQWSLRSSHVGGEVARIEPFDSVEFLLSSLWAEESESSA